MSKYMVEVLHPLSDSHEPLLEFGIRHNIAGVIMKTSVTTDTEMERFGDIPEADLITFKTRKAARQWVRGAKQLNLLDRYDGYRILILGEGDVSPLFGRVFSFGNSLDL